MAFKIEDSGIPMEYWPKFVKYMAMEPFVSMPFERAAAMVRDMMILKSQRKIICISDCEV